MPEILIWSLVFIASLAVLIKAADVFTNAAVTVGFKLGMPAFIVGVTIVSIGTSLPELISSIYAVMQGSSEMVMANVVGSNIVNIFLVLGIAAIIGKKLTIKHDLLKIELPIFLASAFLIAFMMWDGTFSLFEGVLTIIAFVTYLFYSASTRERRSEKKEKRRELDVDAKEEKFSWKTIAMLFVGTIFIYIGARYTVTSVITISEILGVSAAFISITAVALGTSLPELVVTISALRKGRTELIIGNILGSNIFNALAVSGIASFFGDLTVPQSILSFGLPMMLVASLLYFVMTQEKEITLWEGAFLLIFYVFFIVQSFAMI